MSISFFIDAIVKQPNRKCATSFADARSGRQPTILRRQLIYQNIRLTIEIDRQNSEDGNNHTRQLGANRLESHWFLVELVHLNGGWHRYAQRERRPHVVRPTPEKDDKTMEGNDFAKDTLSDKETRKAQNSQSEHMPLRSLTLSDAPMFQRIMSDADICKEFVGLILNKEMGKIVYHNTEQIIEPGIGKKGVRFDAYLKDESTAYDIEMQSYPRHRIGRRMRYYQAAMDTELLSKGDDYDKLPESYVIFICTSDPLGLGLSRYDIECTCIQNPCISVASGSHWIALNAKAYRNADNERLGGLLQYVNEGIVNDDPLVQRIDKAVAAANHDRKWVSEVFCGISEADDLRIQARIEKEDARAEGLAEGRAEGRIKGRAEGRAEGAAEEQARYGKLVTALISKGEIDRLQAAATDSTLLAKLYEEYGLK